ncbi:3-isopropylmalate dehydratase small subunit [Roseomonas sp. SSH11]|uniref:3-isopropylmalate dehydratase n=1 Tax=Pararoseomonas baculiformis TaxID=2820812 RepID=A0ABS4AJU6_9PROT|nr:3-isopropylmalate dehydratase small subunit [Pararoseomonas baculiformis]MBP0447290.1 3-isopropylmalate dehydratase small subunit [Pararoseomonas baculiformis]
MQPFGILAAAACPLPLANLDTDQLIPARFMSRPRSAGYGDFLLHDLRRGADGALRPDFPLNRPERAGAAILVARRNFGSGSSREAAAYALLDGGIRCVLAPSFGDIFASNAVNNGLLPARLAEEQVETLLAWLEEGGREVTVDLLACSVAAGSHRWGFAIDPVWRTKLLNGWSDVDLTLSHAAEIEAFMAADRSARPWAWLDGAAGD